MKVRVLAWNTFGSLVRDKLIVIICSAFVCIVLFMVSPLLMVKAMPESSQPAMRLSLVSIIEWSVSGFGSLLAALASASAVADEIKSGTILAVMARPVRRWEFLLGKFLGVQVLMLVYVLAMLALTLCLTAIGGGRMQSTLWPLIAYPMVRYAVYGSLALLLVTRMHPWFAFAIVVLISAVSGALSPDSMTGSFLPGVLRHGIYAVLPSFDLLSETRFLTISQAQLKSLPWSNHVITLAYGLDLSIVLFVLAAWSFRRRSL